MNVPKRVKAMPWPEKWKWTGQQNVVVTLSWPVVNHERLLVATFRRNQENKWITGEDFRVVCSKKSSGAVLLYRDGTRAKKGVDLEAAARNMHISIETCYPEISMEDEMALSRWLG